MVGGVTDSSLAARVELSQLCYALWSSAHIHIWERGRRSYISLKGHLVKMTSICHMS